MDVVRESPPQARAIRSVASHLRTGRDRPPAQICLPAPQRHGLLGGGAAVGAGVQACGASAIGGMLCACAGFGLATLLARRRNPSPRPAAPSEPATPLPPPSPQLDLSALASAEDRRYLQLLFDAKAGRAPPIHSGMRVAALIRYTDLQGTERSVIGHNSEVAQPAIAGAICAERAAMLQALGLHYGLASLVKVYIISDVPPVDGRPVVGPGCLCREFLWEYGGAETPCLIAAATEAEHSADSTVVCDVKPLGEYYPHPPILRRVPLEAVEATATRLAAAAEPHPFAVEGPEPTGQGGSWPWPVGREGCAKLFRAVLEAAQAPTATGPYRDMMARPPQPSFVVAAF